MKKTLLITVKRLICVILFFAIVISIASFSSYLFRFEENDYATKMIKGFYALEKDSIDIVYIGSSAVFRYNSPPLAYDQTGYTSYNLCSPGYPFEATLTLMKEAEKRQHPSVYVVDIRRFYRQLESYRSGWYEKDDNKADLLSSMSFVVNNMPLSLNRAKLIYDFYGKQMGEDAFEWLFDYMRTHENWKDLTLDRIKELLKEATNYKNENFLEYNGAFLAAMWKPLETPNFGAPPYTSNFTPEDMEPLGEIMDYAEKKGLNVVYLNPPYYSTKSHYGNEKYVEEYITGRGGVFLNCNELYDEIGIDFKTDFYDNNHVNVSGGIKTTIYVSNIIDNTFDIKKKELSEAQREYWENLYEKWKTEVEEPLMKKLDKLIAKGYDPESKK